MNFAIAGPMPSRSYISWMPAVAASACSRSGSAAAAGGSCATSVRTCSGCRATSASALTAPPLLAKTSTGPASSAEINRCRSSAWSSGVDSLAPSVRSLRPVPRGSYVTTVRSRKCSARVVNPPASIGDPIISSTGSMLSVSASRMS
jgi:hypothetical protein